METKEVLITFKTAKLAKEKGFNWNTLHCFTDEGSLQYSSGDEDDNGVYNHNSWDNFSAPSQSVLQKWMREQYNTHLEINVNIMRDWYYTGYNLSDKRCAEIKELYEKGDSFVGVSYEEALEQVLFEALSLIG